MMSPVIEKKLGKLDRQLETLFSYLSAFSNQEFNRHPAPDSWSAAQVMHHLMLSEKLSLNYCKKKLSFNPQLKKAGILTILRSNFVQLYLLSPLKFKAPKGVDSTALPESDTIDNVSAQWRSQRKQLHGFFIEVPENILDKQLYKHPVGGRLSLKGMLDFFDTHFQHHLPQIRKALKSVES